MFSTIFLYPWVPLVYVYAFKGTDVDTGVYKGAPYVCSKIHVFNDFNALTILEDLNLFKSFSFKTSITNLLLYRLRVANASLMSKYVIS